HRPFRPDLGPQDSKTSRTHSQGTRHQDGLRVFESALRTAQEAGRSSFDSGGVVNQIVRQKGSADIEFSQQVIVWRFDDEKLSELIALTESLTGAESAAHQYIDINSPTSTLVISVGEHV
ncbi:hypothetical protein, partial [Mycobacteroides abscessus]|uniref:hypothetical protein n=1 Tax=Mycobacteroides abscessus TaxID=36809 RepID=UPI001F19A080